MTTILKDSELTDKMDNILLWLDNDQYLYNKLQQINKDCIFEYQYYNTWYIREDKRQNIKSHIWKYRDLITDIIDFVNTEDLNINASHKFKLARYLYKRELDNAIFNFNTGLNATKTVLDILENRN